MINSITPSKISPDQGKLIAYMDSFSLVISMSEKDMSFILDQEEMVEIFIEMELSETSIELIGFAQTNRRDLYRALKNVAGIGSKSSLIILDCGEVIDVLRAVSGKDNNFLKEVPGIGDKRIDQIFNELEKRYQKALPAPIPIAVKTWVEARSALVQSRVDFSKAELMIIEAIKKDPDKKWESEDLYKSALAMKKNLIKKEED